MEADFKRRREDDIVRIMSFKETEIRVTIIDQMDMMDIIWMSQADKDFRAWMKRNDIWRHIWTTRIIPQTGDDTRLGPDERRNCLAWYFASEVTFFHVSQAYIHVLRDISGQLIEVQIHKGNFSTSLLSELKLLANEEEDVHGNSNCKYEFHFQMKRHEKQTKRMKARVIYLLFKYGFYIKWRWN